MPWTVAIRFVWSPSRQASSIEPGFTCDEQVADHITEV
jgi:hypothetical protein